MFCNNYDNVKTVCIVIKFMIDFENCSTKFFNKKVLNLKFELSVSMNY